MSDFANHAFDSRAAHAEVTEFQALLLGNPVLK